MDREFNCVNCGRDIFGFSVNFRKKFDFTNSEIKQNVQDLNIIFKELESKSNSYYIPSNTLKNVSCVYHGRGHIFYSQSIDNVSFRCINCGYIYTDKLKMIMDKLQEKIFIKHNLYKNKKGF
jgi:hypothetical protein